MKGPSRVYGINEREVAKILVRRLCFHQCAANMMFLDYGVHHSFVFVESEYTRAVLSSVSMDLVGKAYLGGLMFEF